MCGLSKCLAGNLGLPWEGEFDEEAAVILVRSHSGKIKFPEDRFSPGRIEVIYNAVWGIESSFRKLKYTVGLGKFPFLQGGAYAAGNLGAAVNSATVQAGLMLPEKEGAEKER